MNLDTFYATISGAAVLLIGENHDYIGDTAMLVTLAGKFVRAGRKPIFLFEQFPGRATNKALINMVKSEVEKGKWDAVNTFLKSKLDIEGEGSKSPLEAWGYPKGEWRLKVLLRFVQINGLARGHDIPFDEQSDLRKAGADIWLDMRNKEMATKTIRAHKTKPTSIIFCFLGRAHVAPQLKYISNRISHVYSLQPKEDFDFRRPATTNTVVIETSSGVSFVYSMP